VAHRGILIEKATSGDLSAPLMAAIFAALSPPTVTHDDVVTYWNQQAAVSMDASGIGLPVQARTLTILHISIYGALAEAPARADTMFRCLIHDRSSAHGMKATHRARPTTANELYFAWSCRQVPGGTPTVFRNAAVKWL
jgi:hypothetical protein